MNLTSHLSFMLDRFNMDVSEDTEDKAPAHRDMIGAQR